MYGVIASIRWHHYIAIVPQFLALLSLSIPLDVWWFFLHGSSDESGFGLALTYISFDSVGRFGMVNRVFSAYSCGGNFLFLEETEGEDSRASYYDVVRWSYVRRILTVLTVPCDSKLFPTQFPQSEHYQSFDQGIGCSFLHCIHRISIFLITPSPIMHARQTSPSQLFPLSKPSKIVAIRSVLALVRSQSIQIDNLYSDPHAENTFF